MDDTNQPTKTAGVPPGFASEATGAPTPPEAPHGFDPAYYQPPGSPVLPPLWSAPGMGPPPPAYPAPPLGQWAPPPPPSGFFRKRPLLVILAFVFIVVIALFVIIAIAAPSGDGGGLSSMSFGDKVGIVKIEGVIVDSTEAVEQIHRLRDDAGVKAVVVRIDSPGGVVAPSQEIYYELKKLGELKPVVVSMGAVAASGGYYVACPAQEIYANPGTITGSIGVVMELTNLEGLLEWAKIKNSVIKSGQYKDIGSPYREMTAEEKKLLQDFVDSVHRQFEDAVAKGRGIPIEKVREIANGSIYTGEQAKELDLVDAIGDLWDAIDRAAKLGGISGKPNVVWPPKKQPNIFGLFNSLAEGLADPTAAIASPVRVMYIMRID